MKIVDLAASSLLLALGLAAWRLGAWIEADDDGGSSHLISGRALIAWSVALILFGMSIQALFVRRRHVRSSTAGNPPVEVPKGLGVARPGREYDRLFE